MREELLQRLEEKARQMRVSIVDMCHAVGPARKGHPGPALSCADILAALFFHQMKDAGKGDAAPHRDRFVLSKGHACPVLYAALYRSGILTQEQMGTFRRVGGVLQGHPDMKGTPGVDMTAGSLGHGLSAGAGMALAAKLDEQDTHVYVVLGDGECQEGLVWEAAMLAPARGLDNLVAIVDKNGQQSCGTVPETMSSLEPLAAKWSAFGWNVIEIDGHDMAQVVDALDLAGRHTRRPTVIIADTVKGKGVSFMENNNAWHQRTLTDEEHRQALQELGEGGACAQ
jgi:transketolase